jgi:hypothetical protein
VETSSTAKAPLSGRSSVQRSSIFDLHGQKLYAVRGINIYKLSGELVGHLSDANTAGARLNKLADKLFHGN